MITGSLIAQLATATFIVLVLTFSLWRFMRLRNKQKQAVRREPTLGMGDIKKDMEKKSAPSKIEPASQIKIITKEKNSVPVVVLKAETKVPPKTLPEVVTFYILARTKEPFRGYELLQTLLNSGFRYGALNIFHRHEKENGEGEILFSLAQAFAPGTFELSNMGATTCAGLTLFMQVPEQKELIKSFDLMIDTAQNLAEELGGSLLDNKRAPLTAATLANLKQSLLV